MNQNLSPPKNANARQRTGRARKTKLSHTRLNPASKPVKSDLLDFLRRPSLATFLRAFPNFRAGNQSGHAEKDSAKTQNQPQGAS
jgi:hypothetical protein